jgi:sulfite oxidase
MFDLFRTKPNLIVHSKEPLNAEPPLDRLRAAYITPQNAELKPGRATLRGYAVAMARTVVRVDRIEGWRPDMAPGRAAARPGSALEPDVLAGGALELPPGEHELAVRAWDSAGQTQPAAPDDTWNLNGYLSAS